MCLLEGREGDPEERKPCVKRGPPGVPGPRHCHMPGWSTSLELAVLDASCHPPPCPTPHPGEASLAAASQAPRSGGSGNAAAITQAENFPS